MTDDNTPEEFEGAYIVDSGTQELISTVIGVLHMAAMMQLSEESRQNLTIIADELGERFGIDASILVEEEAYSDPETGEEEIIYKPHGGLFQDDDEDPAASQDDDA